MKRISVLILTLTILLCACNSGGTSDTHADVSVCYPTDNTVNGYRTSSGYSSVSDGSMPDEIAVSEVKPGSGVGKTDGKTGSFVGNKNSHVFHKPDCSSAKKAKSENKVYFSTRDEAVSSGYTPCKRCSP